MIRLQVHRVPMLLKLTFIFLLLCGLVLEAAPIKHRRRVAAAPLRRTVVVRSVVRNKTTSRRTAAIIRTAVVRPAVLTRFTAAPRPNPADAPIIRGGPWTEPTYADSTAGDFVDGEDLTIRRAA